MSTRASALRLGIGSAAGWLLLSVVYATVIYTQSFGAMSPPVSMRVAVENTFAPAAMGAGVWWLAGRHHWPERGLTRFLVLHGVLALAFAGAWSAWMLVVAGGGRMTRDTIVHTALPWQAVMGLMLYGLIAGASSSAHGALRSRDLRVAAGHADRLRVEAELAALRAHINPHFLFNTLHSLSELLRSEPAAAEQAIERLSELFRYSLRLDRHNVTLVRFEDELRFTESYLWLEQMRMGSRLRIATDIDDDALACLVPPFILQPVVENAIRHGLAPAPAGGTLALHAHEEEGFLIVRVADDGLGAEPAMLMTSEGLGLRSVTQRLASRYGARASVEATGSPQRGITVTMRFPAGLAA